MRAKRALAVNKESAEKMEKAIAEINGIIVLL